VNVLFGKANPSAKLPFTIAKEHSDIGFGEEHYKNDNNECKYEERHHFGYRWFDHHKVEPAYPFGHGLSYTEFEYSNIIVD